LLFCHFYTLLGYSALDFGRANAHFSAQKAVKRGKSRDGSAKSDDFS
jgi:hypothetical protein